MRFLYLIFSAIFLMSCQSQATADMPEKFHLWNTVEINVQGLESSEDATTNPFTDLRLMVEFTAPDGTVTRVRGFFAADGRAQESSATSGNIWRARFSPNQTGNWTWRARLASGPMIAVDQAWDAGQDVPLRVSGGSFVVESSDVTAPDFRAPERGLLRTDGSYFRFVESENYWLKGGVNSPENFFAFDGFDGTYRIGVADRDGESKAGSAVHTYAPHAQDWRKGDPTWQDGKGKGIIGAINYLADQGMNAIYFLTYNIDGDGKDVWPFADPTDFMRFDVSKLEQWEIVFDHMQSRGILLHVVLQETENELLMDGGDTGDQRQLYLAELISRFAHHPALVWNIGEENGPVFWRPEGQTDDQRRDMIRFLRAHDPYDHPIVLHTHSEPDDKDHIAGPLLGMSELDGLSFQVSDRRLVNQETRRWLENSKAAGRPWMIAMDEIGQWHTGARPDANDPHHDSLRRHAMWGHLFAGGAGVEWYFGGLYEANDLNSEDLRKRENLWAQTKVTLDFFDAHLPYWEMSPCDGKIDRSDSYCFGKDDLYVIYLIEGGTGVLTLPKDTGAWDIYWFDPITGGALKRGTVKTITGGKRENAGFSISNDGRDRVIVLRRQP